MRSRTTPSFTRARHFIGSASMRMPETNSGSVSRLKFSLAKSRRRIFCRCLVDMSMNTELKKISEGNRNSLTKMSGKETAREKMHVIKRSELQIHEIYLIAFTA